MVKYHPGYASLDAARYLQDAQQDPNTQLAMQNAQQHGVPTLPPVAPQTFAHHGREGRFVLVQDARKCQIVFYIREGYSTPTALEYLRRRSHKPICVIRVQRATTPLTYRMMERAARNLDVQSAA